MAANGAHEASKLPPVASFGSAPDNLSGPGTPPPDSLSKRYDDSLASPSQLISDLPRDALSSLFRDQQQALEKKRCYVTFEFLKGRL